MGDLQDHDFLETMSKEELIALIDELNRDLEEKDQEVMLLQRKARKGGGRDDESDVDDILARAATDAELEDVRNKLEEYKIENSAQKDKIAELNSHLKAVEAEKLEAEADCRRLRKKADDYESQLNTVQETTRSSMRKSQDISKQQKDAQKQQLQLFQENERLQEEKAELTKKVEERERDLARLEEAFIELNESREQLESEKNSAEDLNDTYLRKISELEELLDETQNKIQATVASESSWKVEASTLKNDAAAQKARHDEEVAKLKEEISSLNQQMNILKDTTSVGTKQHEIDVLKQELSENLELMDEMRELLDNADAEKSQLVERLLAYDKNFEAQLYDKISAEKESTRILQKKLQSTKNRLDETESRIAADEKEKASLQREVDELNNWKSIYESGHGFQELAKHQQRLKEDNRRLVMALEQTSEKVGEIMDSNALLMQAFEKLKADCGVDPDFYYPDSELREEMLGENARLKSQVSELDEQISSLEKDNIRLRKTLKNQAGSIGEQGFKFQGMSADMLVKVNEFATSLREGNVELPLNDRSAELLAENRKLKDEIQIFSAKVERYERDIAISGGVHDYGRGNGHSSDDLQGVRDDLQRLMVENSGLKDRLALMQDEIMVLLDQNRHGHANSSEDIENMLLANNEMLMKELQELRIAAAANRAASPRQTESHAQSDDSVHGTYQQCGDLPPTGRNPKLQLNLNTSTPRMEEPSTMKNYGQPFTNGTPVRYGAGPLGTPIYHAPPGSVRGGIAAGVPTTPHGKQLLSKTIGNLRLPPEEWADEVKELNSQLIECLEQLYERENELYETRGVVSSLEEALVNIKSQTAVLYYDFAEKSVEWERKEKQAKVELLTVIGERDDTKLKLKRTQETVELMQREDPSELESKLREYSKKISIFEVNEAILARRYTALSEQLNEESAMRRSLEAEFCEMEGALKKRILFLEHNKAEVGRHVDSLQSLLDVSVPQTDYFSLQTELECLREDHLAALSRELNARIGALKVEEECRELSTIKLSMAMLDAELQGANASRQDLSAQLEHQKEATRRAIEAAAGPSTATSANELGLLVSEMARFRGEAGRLEVELVAANRRAELLREQLSESSNLVEQGKETVKKIQAQLDQSLVAEQASRKECLALRLKYQGGLVQEAAEMLNKQLLRVSEEKEKALADAKQQTEIAEIATQQTQSMASFRDTYMDDLKELRIHCQKLESRTDDDLLIGRLQRTLMSTKSSYKTFARKYQLLRASMRQRDLAMRVMETRLDNREQAVIIMRETQRVEVSALKKAIRVISNMAEEDNLAEAEINRILRQSANNAGEVFVDDTMSLVSPRPIGAYQDDNDKLNPTGFVSIGQRLLQLSRHIEDLWQHATNCSSRADAANKKCMQFEADLEDMRVEKDILYRKCEDMNVVLSSSTGNGDFKQHQSVKTIATRLSSLTDEVKSLKLSNLAHKREISTLKSQKKHMQELLGRFEDDVRDLEKLKVAGETKALLNSSGLEQQGSGKRKGKRAGGESDDASLFEDFVRLREKKIDPKNHEPPNLESVRPSSHDSKAGHNLVIDNEEFIRRLEEANNKYNDSQRELSNVKSRLDAIMGRLAEAGDILQEKEEQLAYCERVMEAENLPLLRNTSNVGARTATPAANRQFRIMKEEQDKLQEAASATIGSLRLMLDEKNASLEKYQAKVEALQTELLESGGRKAQSVADRRADDLLKKLQAEDERALNGYSHVPAPLDPESAVAIRENQKLLDQLDNADEVLKDKTRTIMQLEQKLNITNNQRERAEERCAASLQEMEAMKSDLLLVVQQLQASEERVAALQRGQIAKSMDVTANEYKDIDVSASDTRRSGPVPTNAKIKDLMKQIKAKDDKLHNYRGIILRLKDEFIKAEEDRAIREADRTAGGKSKRSGIGESGGGAALAGPELDDLRSQVSALRDGLKQAKEDLDQARRARENLLKAKQAVEMEAEKFESQVARAEAQAVASQEMLQRCRKDLEDSRRKEVRLRDKLREMLSTGANSDRDPNGDNANLDGRPHSANAALRRIHSKVAEDTETQSKIQTLERDIEVLKAQNQALRRTQRSGDDTEHRNLHINTRHDDSHHEDTAAPLDVGTKEDLRQQLHAKWESEKRLQKRVSVLEKRLQDKVTECEDAQVQLRKTKESLQQYSQHSNTSAAARERERKEREDRAHRKAISGVSPAEMEAAQRRIFDLEDDLSQMRRKCEVEMPNEIASLRFQCDSLRARVGDLNKQLEQTHEQLRKRAASSGLRDEEDQFLRLEQMRDDLEAARRQKMELEAVILEKDSRIIELSFEAESASNDIDRYRRRTQELENYCRDLVSQNGKPSAAVKSAWGGDGMDTGDVRGPGARFKRERDLEGVVEAMKVVVDKLKLENDRLRKGVGVQSTSNAAGDSNNRIKQDAQKKKLEALEEELANYKSKIAKNEDSSQKLVQKTQQIASLRKAIKHKEDELAEASRRADEFEGERENFRKTLRDAQSRIQQLELQISSRVSAREAGAGLSAAATEIAEWKRKAGEANIQINSLQESLVETRKELALLRSNKGGYQPSVAGTDGREIAKLKSENEKLKKELSAFDLEFFEEIENLKYAHAEAMKKLKMYERQDIVGSRTYR